MSAVFNGGGVGGRVERQRDALSLAITQMHPPTPLLLPPPLRLLPTVHLAVRRPAAPRHIIKILGCHAYKSQPTSLEMPGGPEGVHFPFQRDPQINSEEPGGSSASKEPPAGGAAGAALLQGPREGMRWECDASSWLVFQCYVVAGSVLVTES